MKLAILFHRFGPYHLARIEAAARGAQVTAIEISGETAEYAWDKVAGARGFARVTLFPASDSRQAPAAEVQTRLRTALDEARPEVVAIPGWSDRAAFIALDWCLEHGVPAVVMSESTAHDEPRVWWKEWVKLRLVRLFSSGLVGGRLHADYLAQLGLPRENLFPGYDVVDNAHFAVRSTGPQDNKTTGQQDGPDVPPLSSPVVPWSGGPMVPSSPGPFFLASARFIEKKNLPFLLRAYARYRELSADAAGQQDSRTTGQLDNEAIGPQDRPDVLTSRPVSEEVPQSGSPVVPWSLVVLGDGPLRSDLCSLISDLSLQDSVLLPGFKQYDELPGWYARAGAFVHASTTEQWGLVVNEAMAAGLPVLVSNRCGCAPDLVQEGVNGYTFDPTNVEQLATLLLKVSAFGFPLSTFGAQSRAIIAGFAPEQFGHGLRAAAERALARPRPRAGALDRWLLQRLMRR